jgi:UDP-N-acetylmuramoyl-L-alanyl-D-glutamate--2,6-diaminopimelate ligase
VRLMELLSALPGADLHPADVDPEIRRVVPDSRRISPGDLFVAIRGRISDGQAYVPEALARGAAAVVAGGPPPAGVRVPWVCVREPRKALGLLAAHFSGNPAERLVMAGVTGTNGKTTTAVLLQSLLERRFGGAGFVGTIGYRIGRRELPADRTTPDAALLQELLAEMVREGIPAASMEVSSHALALDRVEGCRFDLAVFTNLTRDHLDFHHDMESYYGAKRRLFDLRKSGAPAVVNAADPYGRRLAGEIGGRVVTYSTAGGDADLSAGSARCDLAGTSFDAVSPAGRFRVSSKLLGRFNVDNLLAAAAGGLALGLETAQIAAGLAAVERVPGRFELVEAGQPYPILVDYAHTEDALERLLSSVRELTDRKVILVFGCGGDRDRGKRAPMGRIAGTLAHIPIATSDNPRSENPETILSEVERGLAASGATKYLRIADRREAIRAAIDLANPGTVVVIAGKGHETTQVIAGREEPFDDRLVAAEFASRR